MKLGSMEGVPFGLLSSTPWVVLWGANGGVPHALAAAGVLPATCQQCVSGWADLPDGHAVDVGAT